MRCGGFALSVQMVCKMGLRMRVWLLGVLIGTLTFVGAHLALRYWNARTKATYQLPVDLFVRGNPYLKEVALTFDDGPYQGSTAKILDVLKSEKVHATFFIIGKHIDEHPSLVRRMLNEGHEVGNHTYDHQRLDQLSAANAEAELRDCESAFGRATGSKMFLMRPPGMRFNNQVLSVCQDMDYVTVHWNVAVGDFEEIGAPTIVARVLKQVKNGSVILLHDCPQTAEALPAILRAIKAQGFRFQTTSRMLARMPRPVIVASNAHTVRPELNSLDIPKVATLSRPSSTRAKPKQPPGVKAAVLPKRAPIRSKPEDVPTWDGPATEPRKSEEPEPSLG